MRKSAKITLVTLTQMHNIKQGKNYSPGSTQLSKIELIILSQVFFASSDVWHLYSQHYPMMSSNTLIPMQISLLLLQVNTEN